MIRSPFVCRVDEPDAADQGSGRYDHYTLRGASPVKGRIAHLFETIIPEHSFFVKSLSMVVHNKRVALRVEARVLVFHNC
jgi:hypothetical protein